ncbi:MAG: hemin uptake protein HemP [Pseudazoarcus pumilus]|nr:hemin uptake protein HemP [Pseudazoarcus pumilus]
MHNSAPADCPDRSAHAAPPSDDAALTAEALSSAALLQGGSCIAIDHLGTRYVLRATRAGKLILTK